MYLYVSEYFENDVQKQINFGIPFESGGWGFDSLWGRCSLAGTVKVTRNPRPFIYLLFY